MSWRSWNIKLGQCAIDLAKGELHKGSDPVPYGTRAFDTLAFLVVADERLVVKDELMSAVSPNADVQKHDIHVELSPL